MSDNIVYYYNRKIPINGNLVNADANTLNVTNNGEYSGYSTYLASIVPDGGLDQNIILNYFGYRTPEKFDGIIPPYFTEILNIKNLDKDSFIVSTLTYEDSGLDGTTSVPFNKFVVTGASGIFEGYKFVKITYFLDFTRTVEITKQ
jgi:hypothetical protein